MHIPAEKADTRLMRHMFGVIAPKYDFITRVFSYGMDRRWKRKVVEMSDMPDRPLLLYFSCGTGDFSKLVAARSPSRREITSCTPYDSAPLNSKPPLQKDHVQTKSGTVVCIHRQ
jgi:ubiquinone/menaquinone biosynthesis C-methylase UbiE